MGKLIAGISKVLVKIEGVFDVAIEYNKLVRDRIPEIIRQSGKECEIAFLSDGEYSQALRMKLIEEAGEVAEAEGEDLVAELADLYEVIDALMASYGIAGDRVLQEQIKKRQARGGFAQKILLGRVL